MSIQVTCNCGQRFAAKDHLAGKQVKCPSCGGAISIPTTTPPEKITVACGCGRRFQAPRNLAGKQVKCPACGAPLTIPTANSQQQSADPLGPLSGVNEDFWSQPAASPSPLPSQTSFPAASWQQPPGTAKKKSFNWRLPVLLGSGIAGLAAIIIVVVVVVGKVSNSDGPPTDSDSPFLANNGTPAPPNARNTIDPLAKRFLRLAPADPAIQVTDENFVPDPELLKELKPHTVGDYTIHLPSGFERFNFNSPTAPRRYAWKRTINGKMEVFFFDTEAVVVDESLIKEIETTVAHPASPVYQNYKAQRCTLNGRLCWRLDFEVNVNGQHYYLVNYQFLDGNRNVVVDGRTSARPGTRDFDIFETALRSVRRR